MVRTCGVLCILTCTCASVTAACNFSTSELQKLLRSWGVLCILTCKCPSHQSGVVFFEIVTSKIGPGMWCFVHFDLKMCFAPQLHAIFHFSAEHLPPHPPLSLRTSGTTNHRKNTAIRNFPNIWRMCIFFLVTLLVRWSSFFWLDFLSLLFNCPYFVGS